MSLPCHLKVMGPPELFAPDGRTLRLKVRKHLALLIYLAVERRPVHQRDELVELLWERAGAREGRHSLSQALFVLRPILGPDALTGSHAEVRFDRGSVGLDLDQLVRGEVLATETRPALEVDAFLTGFVIDDAPAFQHWRDRTHARHLGAIQMGLLMLLDEARRVGRVGRVAELAERMLRIDHLSEEGVRGRLEALAMGGDRVGALRVYEEWKRQLREQLDAEPSPALEVLATRLRRGPVGRAPGAGPPILPAQAGARPFIGRGAEYRILFEAWETTTQYQTRHVLLEGESGIGKTTLALRFAAAAALEGAIVGRVQCFELEQRIPFGMVGALVTALLDQPGAAGTSPESLAEIGRIVPRVRERFSGLPKPKPIAGEAARLHFAEGVFALLSALMDEHPVVLIVDDYPRADEASLAVLHMLLRRSPGEPLMVILTGRPSEPGEPAQAARIRSAVAYLPLTRIELHPMSEEESGELLAAVVSEASHPPTPPDRRALLRAARGNPLVLELLAQDWVAHGDTALALALPAMQEDVPRSALEVTSCDRLLDRVLPDLTLRSRQVLNLATVLGARIKELAGYAVAELTEAQTLAALSELVERRILRETAAGLEFVNELVRARVYLRIPQAVRRRLHNAVADRLLAAPGKGPAPSGLEVAWHCIRAGRTEEATPFLMRGAREAMAHGAPDEAARSLSSALRRLQGVARDEATLLLAETLQEMSLWKESEACLRQLARRTRARPKTQSTELQLILGIHARRHLTPLQSQDAHQAIAALRRLIETGSTSITQSRAALVAVQVAGELRSVQQFEELHSVVNSLHVETLSRQDLAVIAVAQAMNLYHRRLNALSRAELDKAARLMEDLNATNALLVEVHLGLGATACANGEYGAALASLDRGLAIARRLDNDDLVFTSAVNAALAHLRLGRYDEIDGWINLARSKIKETSPAAAKIALGSVLGWSGGFCANKAQSLQALELLRSAAATTDRRWVWASSTLMQADTLYLMGDKREALEMARYAIGSVQLAEPALSWAGPFARWLALSGSGLDSPSSFAMLRQMFEQRQKYDRLDRAEIAGAFLVVAERVGAEIDAASQAMRLELASLPLACSRQVARLGLDARG